MASQHVAVCLEPAPAVTAARYATAKVTKVIHKLFVIVTSQARQGVKLTRAQIIARSTDYTLGGGDERGRHEQINVWHAGSYSPQPFSRRPNMANQAKRMSNKFAPLHLNLVVCVENRMLSMYVHLYKLF